MEFSRQEYWSGLPFPSPISYEVQSHTHTHKKSFPGGASGKEPSCQCKRNKRHGFDSWVRKIPCRRKWQPTPVLLPGKFHGWRSLVGYSPWGCKESDTTEQLHWFTGRTRGLRIETGEPGKLRSSLGNQRPRSATLYISKSDTKL